MKRCLDFREMAFESASLPGDRYFEEASAKYPLKKLYNWLESRLNVRHYLPIDLSVSYLVLLLEYTSIDTVNTHLSPPGRLHLLSLHASV
jgi:hypothetical protein